MQGALCDIWQNFQETLTIFIGKFSVISCVAVAVTLLLVSILDIWKLELGLAPYSITAAVGVLTLAVVIKKYWVTQRSKPDTNRDKSRRKLESQQHSAEKSKKSTDTTGIFSFSQCIEVMVSNYHPLQAIYAITQGECHTREIKADEQFSPIVTIVDGVTKPPLDYVLLLHGKKPPEISSRTLFYYIAVQVSYCDEHGSHHHPMYHMDSKPCKQGRLPLILLFSPVWYSLSHPVVSSLHSGLRRGGVYV